MILAIVGSTKLVNNAQVEAIIAATIARYQPHAIISGGAQGVDKSAERVAAAYLLPCIICRPALPAWSEFKKRNLLIAQLCDRLIRIALLNSRTYGSGWTRDRAVELGKPVEEYFVEVA